MDSKKTLSKLEKKLGLFFADMIVTKRNYDEDKALLLAVKLIDITICHKAKGEKAFRNAIFISSRIAGASVKEANEFVDGI